MLQIEDVINGIKKKPIHKSHILFHGNQTGLKNPSSLGQVSEGGVVCGSVGAEGAVVERVDGLGHVPPVLAQPRDGAGALLYLKSQKNL